MNNKIFILITVLFFGTFTYMNAQDVYHDFNPEMELKKIDTSSTPCSKSFIYFAVAKYYSQQCTSQGYEKAITFFNKCIDIGANSNNNECRGFHAIWGVAAVYERLGDENNVLYAKALSYYLKAKKMNDELIKDSIQDKRLNIVLAKIYMKLKDKAQSLAYVQKNITYYQTIHSVKNDSLLNKTLIFASYLCLQLNDTIQCNRFYNQINKKYFPFVTTNTESINSQKYFYLTQAFLESNKHNFTASFQNATLALQVAKFKYDSLEVIHQIIDIAVKNNKMEYAYSYKCLEFDLYKNMINTNSLSNTNNELMQTEILLKDQNTKLLEKQAEFQKRMNRGLLLGLLLLVGFIIYIFTLEQKTKKQNILLAQQNKEKALLMKEIHHRVKNNLEMLQSMLQLQIRKYKGDDNAVQALTEANTRIQSIAILHKQLYNENVVNANANIYFTELFKTILQDNQQMSTNTIQLDFAVENIEINPTKLLPIALLVNEWLTNTLKYAFLNKTIATPTIRFVFKKINESSYEIKYADNGTNTQTTNSENVNVGFGLRLINALVKQIKGKWITEDASSNYTYILHIPIN